MDGEEEEEMGGVGDDAGNWELAVERGSGRDWWILIWTILKNNIQSHLA
jgi:hypothetical protein